MAITSIGYDGSITELQWAALAGYLGADYAVGGPDDWKVEAVAGQDRVVRVKAGDGYGHGVLDTSTADETLQLPLVASGSRWDLVCAHRDWQPPGGATTFGYVQGTATQQLPGGRLADPGVQDDQPLALVQVTAGQQMPTGIVDLRTWPSKVITAGSLLALPDAAVGTIGQVAGAEYVCALDSTGAPVWVQSDPTAVRLSPPPISLDGGTPPAVPTSGFQIRAATVVQDSDQAGYARITFPAPFPNGLISCVLSNGDNSAGALSMEVAGVPWHIGRRHEVLYRVIALAGAGAGTAYPHKRHRVNYIAIGW